MNKKIDGFKAALELLQGLDLARQQELLADMARKDPELVVRLKQKLVTFDDLKYLTATMMRRLLQDIKPDVFGLALRGAEAELVKHILSLVSKNNQQDIEDVLKGKPRSLNDVLDAQKAIMEVVLKLREKGEIILSKDKSEKMV
jgi:flagellar motor switch protein FliG